MNILEQFLLRCLDGGSVSEELRQPVTNLMMDFRAAVEAVKL